MPLLLRRLAGAVPPPLRRFLCTAPTATTRAQWAMLYKKPALDASGSLSFDLHTPPLVSQLSFPAHLVDPDGDAVDFFTGTLRAASSDGLLLLDFADTRHRAPVIGNIRYSFIHEFDSPNGDVEPDVARFVCNPLSGQMFRLPVPDMDISGMSSGFGLLTQSEGSPGPPDRYVVAQLSRSSCRGEEGRGRGVVRRFLSDTGEWDERLLTGSSTMPAGRLMCIHKEHEVLAFGDRLWWVDVSWGACSVDPFSDRPENRFFELPRGSVLPDLDGFAGRLILGRYRRFGFSEGKLRYVEVSNNKKPFVVSSYSLDDKGCCWTLEHKIAVTPILPERCKRLDNHIPSIAAIDPFNASMLYLDYGRFVLVVDMAKGDCLGACHLPGRIDFRITSLSKLSGFLMPCVLPTWLESSYIPGAGTLSSKNTNCKRKTLAEMLVRVDRGQKN
ncbi:uncharacterized protein LOC100828481 [Brachypodium distachyon]|uniref:DUF1618 domain-containing protein n=1 Tax=Brachypodium distachyon TaxID=15368 RepID=I1HIK1_BRADI|nr:uncharacterized protein LOC100828481 [Brachypodium distachyon]KQK05822.1 hypothetical protein BRADI_2g22730v3 [Brachypodium distachyon]|eukprot:XP_003566165.1 uncharacterized protein LOC100828481 [Brachypodium distachyon]